MPSTGTKQGPLRDAVTGRFKKGNHSGGRKRLPEDLKEAFRAECQKALKTLVSILDSADASNRDKIRAAEIILDRGYGKPVQAVEMDADAAPQIVFIGMDDVLD